MWFMRILKIVLQFCTIPGCRLQKIAKIFQKFAVRSRPQKIAKIFQKFAVRSRPQKIAKIFQNCRVRPRLQKNVKNLRVRLKPQIFFKICNISLESPKNSLFRLNTAIEHARTHTSWPCGWSALGGYELDRRIWA